MALPVADARTYFESLHEVVFAVQENGTFVRANVDVACVYVRCDQPRDLDRSKRDALVGKMTFAITNGDWLMLNVLYTSLMAF